MFQRTEPPLIARCASGANCGRSDSHEPPSGGFSGTSSRVEPTSGGRGREGGGGSPGPAAEWIRPELRYMTAGRVLRRLR